LSGTQVLEWRLSDVQYDPDKCMSLCKTIANDVRDHMKDLYVGLFSSCLILTVATARIRFLYTSYTARHGTARRYSYGTALRV